MAATAATAAELSRAARVGVLAVVDEELLRLVDRIESMKILGLHDERRLFEWQWNRLSEWKQREVKKEQSHG